MSNGVKWLEDYEKAFNQARTENKAVLLDFYNPE